MVPDALQTNDLILVHGREGEMLRVYAVTPGETIPLPWASEEVAEIELITAVSHGYLTRQSGFTSQIYYYAANGRHMAVPPPDPDPQPERQPAEPAPEANLRNWATVWSPNGRYAAHTVERPAGGVPLSLDYVRPLYFFDAETGRHEIIHENTWIRTPRWSADGQVHQLYTDSGPTVAGGYRMVWSPDSQHLAFLGKGRCQTTANNVLIRGVQTLCDAELYLVPFADGEAKRVTNTANSSVKIDEYHSIAWLNKE